jgi:hypothetical protein
MPRLRFVSASAVLLALASSGCATPSGHVEPIRDVTCIAMADVPLAQAIAAAERSSNKRVVDAEYNQESELGCLRGDPGHYDVVFYDGGALSKAIVEADSGAVGPAHEESFFRRIFSLDFISEWPQAQIREGAPAAVRSAITLPMAVDIARQHSQGLPLAAHVSHGPLGTRYAVELVQRDGVHIVFVDLEGRVSAQ